VIGLAVRQGCHAILVEDLDFADARHTGRETLGRGRRGKRFRRIVSGIPTRQFQDLLVGMAANAGLWVVAVDPAWTSVWAGATGRIRSISRPSLRSRCRAIMQPHW
jgi:transposase